MTLLLRRRAKRIGCLFLFHTGASSLFQAGIPEKIIQERTGHRSIKALRMYERTTTSQHVAVSNILSSTTEVNLPQSTAHAHAHAKPVADAGVSFFHNVCQCFQLCY